MTEAQKYTAVWDRPEYRITAPGERYVADFINRTRPAGSDTIIDFGCGTGRAALRLSEYAPVIAMDFAENCLDPSVREKLGERLTFQQHDLTQPLERIGTYGFCTDVMEHIPPEDVDAVLKNITTAAIKVYFNISLVQDHWGDVLDTGRLHLTVQPFDWWREKLESVGFRIDHSLDEETGAVFYGSIYANSEDIVKITGPNTTTERVKANILANLALGFNEICPHEAQHDTIYLLAGGPSLLEFEDEIVALGRAGEKMITANGTYKWLLDRGIKPAAHFMVDAREFNERFIHTIVDTCKYIFSSQTAHEAVVKVPKEQGWIYHSRENDVLNEVWDEHCRQVGYDKEWYPVSGGSTSISRALVVLAMLGFRKIEVFGWDSCLMGDKHHAYEQKENDDKYIVDIKFGGRWFKCHPWMVVQAHEVPQMVKHLFSKIDGFKLKVRGDGLIAHLFNHAAQLGEER